MISPSGWEPLHRRMGRWGLTLRRIIAWSQANDPEALMRERVRARELLMEQLVKIDVLDDELSDPETMLWDLARNDPAGTVRDQALTCLRTFITVRSAPIIPELTAEILEAATTRMIVDRARASAVLLARLGDGGTTALFELSNHESENVRRHAMGACGDQYLPESIGAELVLRGLLDPVPMVREMATIQCRRYIDSYADIRARLCTLAAGDTHEVQWAALLQLEHCKSLSRDEEDVLLRAAVVHDSPKALEIVGRHGRRLDDVIPLIEVGLHRHRDDPGRCFGYLLAIGPIAGRAKHLAPLVSDLWISTAERHGPIYIYGQNDFAAACLSVLEAMLPESLEQIREGLECRATAGDAEEILRRIEHRPF